VRACEDGRWTLRLVDKQTGEIVCVRFRCLSWRHAGICRFIRSMRDSARIKVGLENLGYPLAYLVFTFDPGEWEDAVAAFTGLLPVWKRLHARISHEWGATRYVAMVESHRSGWPHLNVVCSGGLAQGLGRGWDVKPELERMAVGAGFGRICYAQPVQNDEGLSRYLGKISMEIGKSSQVPLLAPAGFRRLRASKGLLPARRSSGLWTGALDFKTLREALRDQVEEPEAYRLGELADVDWVREALGGKSRGAPELLDGVSGI